MLHKRQQVDTRANGTAGADDSDEDEGTEEYEDADYEGEDYEDADYEGAEDYEYEEDSEYDESEGSGEEAGYEEEAGEEEEFTPPSAVTAIRRSWLSSRPKAQPATGTEADARRVNYVNRREQLIGYFLGIMLVALAVAAFLADRHIIYKSSLKVQTQIRHEAPFVLGITLTLAALIIVATVFKRRAALGFTLLLAGIALFNGDFFIGIIYLGTGLWLVFRSMRKSPRAATATATAGARAGASARSTALGRGGSRPDSARTPATADTSRPTPRPIGRNRRLASTSTTSGRYTAPKPARHVPPTVHPEPEPTNRLSAWLKK